MAILGARLMVETLRGLQAGAVRPQPQDNGGATLAPILKKEDGQVDFRKPASEIYNRLRGFQPWPGAYTSFRGKNFRVLAAKPAQRSLAPAELLTDGDRLFAGCGANTGLELLELQIEGKKRMPALDFIHGYRPERETNVSGAS